MLIGRLTDRHNRPLRASRAFSVCPARCLGTQTDIAEYQLGAVSVRPIPLQELANSHRENDDQCQEKLTGSGALVWAHPKELLDKVHGSLQ
jgi:hypothetical protein